MILHTYRRDFFHQVSVEAFRNIGEDFRCSVEKKLIFGLCIEIRMVRRIPEGVFGKDLSGKLNSFCRVTPGSTSSIRVSIENVTLVQEDSVE